MRRRSVGGLLTVLVLLGMTPVYARAEAANHEGALEQARTEGVFLRSLNVSGWASDRGTETPIQVEILVNSRVRATVTANLPRKSGDANGFAARITSPSQPARICARTVAPRGLTGVLLGCKRFHFTVPIRVISEPTRLPPTDQLASFFWVDEQGRIAKELGNTPIVNGVATYAGDPLPPRLLWAVTVHGQTERPSFRSGPMRALPGPEDAVALTRRIAVFRSSIASSFGLNSADGLPEFVMQRLRLLPAAITISSVRLSADSAGHEIVTVRGVVKRLIVSASFTYSLPVSIRPVFDPGHPMDVLATTPAGPATGAVAALGSYADELDRAILEGVDRALESAITRIAAIKLERTNAGFPASLVSIASIVVRPTLPDPTIVVHVHAGAITGDPETVAIESQKVSR